MKVFITITSDSQDKIYHEGIVIPDQELSIDRLDRALEVLRARSLQPLKNSYPDMKPSFLDSKK